MKILFLTADLGGNIPPTLAVAEALTRAGATVEIAGLPAGRTPFVEVPFAPATAISPEPGVKRSRGAGALLRLMAGRRTSDAAAALITERGCDLVVIDCMTLGPIRGALTTTAPVVLLFHTLGAFWVRDFDRGPRGRLLAKVGVRPKKLWDAAAARLLVTDAELDPARDDPALAGFEWTGTTEIGAEPGARGARPRVLVALSSTEWPGMLPVYRRIVEAISDLPIDAVVTTGGAELGGDLVGTANVEVRGWVAHDELLPGVDLLIGHGGHSTTMKALAHGIPLLIIPINPTADQKLMGATMQAAGLGQWLPKSASVQSIRDAVSNLLGASTGGEHTRATAAATGRRLRAAVPGAEVAAARILAIAGAATSQTLR